MKNLKKEFQQNEKNPHKWTRKLPESKSFKNDFILSEAKISFFFDPLLLLSLSLTTHKAMFVLVSKNSENNRIWHCLKSKEEAK